VLGGEKVSEWKECKVSNAPFEIIDGDRGTNYPNQSELFSTGYCLFLNAKNVTTDGFVFNECYFVSKEKDQKLRKGKLQRNDIVLTTRGTVGNIGFYNERIPYENMRINSGMVIIRPDNVGILPEYTYHLFKYMKSDFDVFATGSAQPQLPIRDLNEIFFLLPPLPEQRAIAGVLSSLDNKVDVLQRQNKTLEGMAEALWRKMFVEAADPIWKKGNLGDIAVVNPLRSIKTGTDAIYIDMSNMPTSGPFPLDWIQREFTSGIKFKNGDTIIARITPCLENGKTAYINFLSEEEIGWGSTEYIVLTPKSDKCSEWFYFLARNNDFRDYAIQNMTGTSGRQRVSGESISQFEMCLPTNQSLEKFCEFAGPVMERIKRNSFQIRTLSNHRNTLLPKLMSGKVRIKL
jgi:type I restriction enzyme, S subunit